MIKLKRKAVSIECGAMAQNATVVLHATVAPRAHLSSETNHENLPSHSRVKKQPETYQESLLGLMMAALGLERYHARQ